MKNLLITIITISIFAIMACSDGGGGSSATPPLPEPVIEAPSPGPIIEEEPLPEPAPVKPFIWGESTWGDAVWNQNNKEE